MSIYSLLLDTFGGSTFGRISMIILIDFLNLSWFQLLFNILVGRERMRQNICNIFHLISMFYYPSWLFMISWTFPGGSKRLLQNIYNIFIWFFMFFLLTNFMIKVPAAVYWWFFNFDLQKMVARTSSPDKRKTIYSRSVFTPKQNEFTGALWEVKSQGGVGLGGGFPVLETSHTQPRPTYHIFEPLSKSIKRNRQNLYYLHKKVYLWKKQW